jgi:hypothetical protein
LFVLFGVLWINAFNVAAQDSTPVHAQTTAPLTSRFEMVQSTVVAKLTFKLDKCSGRVWQLVHTTADNFTWEGMFVSGLQQTSCGPSGMHYQIFLSGIAAKFAFLIDTDSGATWQLLSRKDPQTKEEILDWIPI